MLRGMMTRVLMWMTNRRIDRYTINYMASKNKLGATLAGAVERALGSVPYDPPVTIAYTSAVRDVIKLHVPAESSVDVYHTPTSLVVRVTSGDVCHQEILPLI